MQPHCCILYTVWPRYNAYPGMLNFLSVNTSVSRYICTKQTRRELCKISDRYYSVIVSHSNKNVGSMAVSVISDSYYNEAHYYKVQLYIYVYVD